MKSILITIITLSIFSTIQSYGQEISTEAPNTNEESWYSRFTRRNIEESTLFKLGFKSMGMQSKRPRGALRRAYYVELETSVEYKFSPLVSVNLRVKNNFGNRSFDLDGNLYPEFDAKPFYSVDLSPEIRFYLGMKKGIENKKRANNFNGKFIAIQFDEMINIGKMNIKQPKMNLLFGIQQRLGKFGYIDFMFGPSYNIREKEFALFGEFAIGFAF